MKKIAFYVLVILGFAPLSALATTSTFQVHGAQCEDAQNSFQRDQWGISAGTPYPYGPTSSGEFLVRCPIVIDSTFRPTSAWMVVRAYDRHPNVNVTCTLNVTDAYGTILGSATGYTTGNADAAKIFQVGIINLGQPLVSKYFYATCTIPQAYNSARSHLVSFDLNLSN